jgi:integrase
VPLALVVPTTVDQTVTHRDATTILMAYHRCERRAGLPRSQVNLIRARLNVRRLKNGVPSIPPLKDDEPRALRRLKRETDNTEYLFVSERGAARHCQFRPAVRSRRTPAGFTFGLDSYMLRHSCGYKLANDGHTRARCKPISPTRTSNRRYTEMSPACFKALLQC